jgi:assimilatory nitrate reductase catalytic subunit
MITEKAYVLGKFARAAVGTKNIDYNGRLCMVSAGVAYKLAFGIDRSPNPWSDIPKTKALLVIGANIAECAPVATSYLWQMRENGGKLIVADPRMTPITRNADLYLPLRPGTDVALLMGMLHVIVRENLVDEAFIAQHTVGWGQVRDSVGRWDPRTAGEVTGIAPERIEQAALMFGRSPKAMAIHPRGLEHQSKGVENCLALINLCLATGNLGSEGRGCFMITGQGNGQGGGNTVRNVINSPERARLRTQRHGDMSRVFGAFAKTNCRVPG